MVAAAYFQPEQRITLNTDNRLAMALTAYGMPHTMGYLETRAGESHPAPLGLTRLMDAACELGLSAVEAPLSLTPSFDVAPLQEALQSRSLRFIPDFMVLTEPDVEEIQRFLTTAAALGAPVIRATLSRILCGDRRLLPGGWDAHLDAVAKRLNEVLPFAEEVGVCIAVENHQDASSDDLLHLAEMTGHSPAFGVTLDTGNPLAVGEGPIEFAERIAPLIRHVHLKDYTIHFAPEGFRLVRCAAGDGVIDFAAILKIIGANGHPILPGIEIAAQPTRTIAVLELDWWEHYPPVPATRVVPALRILWERGRAADLPYSSAWERGEDSATVSAEEWDVVRRSAEYFRSLSPLK